MSTRGRWLITLGALIVAAALVVGYAHWNLYRLTGGASSWSRDLGIDGGIATAGPNAFVLDDRHDLAVVRIDDGTVLREFDGSDPDPHDLWLGADGSMVVRGSVLDEPQQYAAYDADGQRLWSKELPQSFKTTAIGPQGFTLTTCGRLCETVTFDEAGDEVWSLTPQTDGDWGSGPYWDQYQSQAHSARYEGPITVPTVPTIHRGDRLHTVDENGELSETSIPYEYSSMVGDTMLQISSDDAGCHVRGVRDDAEAFTTTIDCEGQQLDGFPSQVVLEDRLYVALEDSAMLSIDPATGEGMVLPEKWSSFDPETTEAVSVGDEAVVHQSGALFTVIASDDGSELWDKRFTPGKSYDGGALYATARSSGGAVDVKSTYGGIWRALAIGADRPKSRASIFDAQTGAHRGSFVGDDIWDVRGLPDGSALVLADGTLHRIGED